jgi:eukaryotic-like serine/threonine-protein kinase
MKQISELFQAALDCTPAGRAAFLAQACAGDDELQREVELLLAEDEKAASFLEEAPLEAAEVFNELAGVRPGQRIGPYHIQVELGHGGMGVVYLARDRRLNRPVALKLLHAEFTRDPERVRRFIQEAKAASALNHPNILTIYEIGQENGAHYIATEFVNGETLRRHMAGERLEPREALDVSIQIASALTAAHEAGIIHRDVKPENVILRRDGIVKILDFGLAKLTEQTSSSLDTRGLTKVEVETDPGMVLGTPGYMSPEQARGQKVDARSDIFSLGVVLYEMVTGRAPFEGVNAVDVMGAILNREPAPLAGCAPNLPPELEPIINKALRKDREERYQTSRDLLIDLKDLNQELEFKAKLERSAQPATRDQVEAASSNEAAEFQMAALASVPTDKEAGARAISSAEYLIGEIKRHKLGTSLALVILMVGVAAAVYFSLFPGSGQAIDSLAVLPFVNVGADPNTEYLSDGITDSLINSLSQLPKLKVMSRNSVFRYKGPEADAQAAGRQLGVRAVLTGRVVTRGDTLSIVTELVDARDNSHFWGEQYNRKVSELVILQSELSRDISEKLRLRLRGEDKRRLTKRDTENAEAYELYLRGRYNMNSLKDEGLKKSLGYFQRAIEIDPRYGLAYAGLAESYTELANIGTIPAIPPKEGMPKAKAAALKALELDDRLAEAHNSLGLVAMSFEWDWKAAEREFTRAIALNPNYVNARHWYSHYLISMGRFEESLAESQRALALDPLDVGMNFHLGFHYFKARQYDQAVAQLQKTLEMNQHPAAHAILGLAYEQKGLYNQAIAELQKSIELGGIDERGDLGHVYAISGKRDEAQKLLDLLQEESKHKHVSPYNIAKIYEGLGEKHQAFASLEKAYEERDSNIINLKVDPELSGLHSDPRFTNLLQRIGLPQ